MPIEYRIATMDSVKKVESTLLHFMSRGKTLRPARLIERLANATGLSRLEIRDALAVLAGSGKLRGVARSGEPLQMVGWTGSPECLIAPEVRQLQVTLEQYQDLKEYSTLTSLNRHADLFTGLSCEDIASVVRGFLQYKQVEHLGGDLLFNSASHILGSAKALRNLRGAMRSMGEPSGNDLGGEFYVLTAGPSHPKAIVLIENIRSFTAFAHSPHAQESVGIAAYGYGLTIESFGARLAANQVVACPAYGHAPNLKEVMDKVPLYFWGDLDREGLRIFETLRSQFPTLELSAAYAAMEKRCANPMLCHPYHRLFEKEGQRLPLGITTESAHLAEKCMTRAVDQEALGRDLEGIDVVAPYRMQDH